MRFSDELRGSEGQRCEVIDLAHGGTKREGVIESWDDAAMKAVVRYPDGTGVRVGYTFVTLLDRETP
jgi:hypothetical protein